MGHTPRKRKIAADRLASTLIHLPEPPRKLRKLDNTEHAQDLNTTKRSESYDYVATPKPIPRCENPVLDHSVLGELLYHKSVRIFEERLKASSLPDFACSIPKLFHYLFLSTPYPNYQSICFRSQAKNDENGEGYDSIYHTRSSIHMTIFNHILKRFSCLPIIEAEGYRINDWFSSATDAAFTYFLKTVLTRPGLRLDSLFDAHFEKSEEHGSTLVLEDERAIRAFDIFTQHPMRFFVQMKIGQLLQKEYVALVWCQDVGSEGGWDVVWEYMTKSLADFVCPKSNYEV